MNVPNSLQLLRWSLLGAAGAACFHVDTARARALTLDSVHGAPMPTNLEASPTDGRVAWISNKRGMRNIMVAERRRDGSYASRSITNNPKDDGIELDALT